MRAVSHGDAVAAASLIRCRPPETWAATLQSLFDRAHVADLYRKRLGRMHPEWGNGSLTSAVLCDSDVWPEPRLSDPVYTEALVAVLLAVMRWRDRDR